MFDETTGSAVADVTTPNHAVNATSSFALDYIGGCQWAFDDGGDTSLLNAWTPTNGGELFLDFFAPDDSTGIYDWWYSTALPSGQPVCGPLVLDGVGYFPADPPGPDIPATLTLTPGEY